MMDVMPPVAKGTPIVERYGAGSFLVSGVEKTCSVILHEEGMSDWGISGFEELNDSSMKELCVAAKELDILLIGAGGQQEFLKPALREMGREFNLSIDCMDTGAACRTYNVLVGEGRRVMAALILV